MDIVWGVIIFAVFVLDVVFTIYKAKEYIKDDSSLSSKVCNCISFSVCILGIVYNSCTIKTLSGWGLRGLDGSDFGLVDLIGYLFVWWVITALLGSVFAAIQFCSLVVIHFKKLNVSPKWTIPPGGEASVFTAINTMGLLAAFNLMLFAFGVSDWIILQILAK